MKKQEIKNKIYDILEEKLGLISSEINDESNLIEDLGADSLDAVDIIMEVEKVFNIPIPDDDVEKINTVQDLITIVEQTIS